MTVAELLEKCSAQCLLAIDATGCACRCGGEFHGALASATVPAAQHDLAALAGAGRGK